MEILFVTLDCNDLGLSLGHEKIWLDILLYIMYNELLLP